MQKLIYILILSFFISPCFATTYYVATPANGGNNANIGSFASPWATWDRCVGTVHGGDTVFIRGGTYNSPYSNAASSHCFLNGLTGNSGNKIHIFAYPGETPILNLGTITPTYCDPIGIYLLNCSYVHLKGLRVTFLKQVASGCGISRGVDLWQSSNCIFEQIVVDDIGGSAFKVESNSNFNLFKNCDASYVGDPLTDGGVDAYDNADAYSMSAESPENLSHDNVYDGCLATMCSDDGWDCFGTNGLQTVKNCISYHNGYKPWRQSTQVTPTNRTPNNYDTLWNNPAYEAGSGEGFKFGPAATQSFNLLSKIAMNCLAFENRGTGYASNSIASLTTKHAFYNCVAYSNDNDGFSYGAGWSVGATQIFKNCWAWFNNRIISGANWVYDGNNSSGISNNVWMTWYNGINYGNLYPTTQVSAADFLSITPGITGTRNPDGSFVYTNFLRLSPTSDLINKGIDVGLPYCGSAPDVNWTEYCATLTATCGANPTITLPVNTANISGVASGGQTPYTYTWRQITGTATTIVNTTAPTTSVQVTIAGSYTYEFKVVDALGATALDTISLAVNPVVATAPTCSAGTTPVSITLPVNSVALSGSGASTSGNTVSYLWSLIVGSGGTITSPTSAVTTATGLTAGSRTYRLTVTDNGNALTCTSDKVVVTNAALITPTANAGTNQTIILPTNSVSLTGSGSGGTINSYLWTKLSGIGGTFSAATSANTNFSGLAAGVYQVELRVGNTDGLFGRDTVQITVNPAPTAPTCSAGATPVTITLPVNSAALSATGASTSGNTVSFAWIKLSGTGGSITNANTANATATGLTAGVYTYRVTVTDNVNGLTCTSDKTVNVNAAPVIPVANAGSNQTITLPTSSVSLSGSGTGGTINSYQWTILSGIGGSLSAATSQNTNLTGLVAGVYLIQLRVGNTAGNFGLDSMTVTVNPAVVLPTANAGTDKVIALPTNAAAMNGSGTGTGITYQWVKLPSSPSAGSIQSPTSAVTQGVNLVEGVYFMQLTVTDINAATAKDTMTITVGAQPNIPPVVNAGADQRFALPTSSTSVTGSVIISNGTLAGVLWSQVQGATVTITTPSSLTTTITGFTTAGVYKFKLFAQDSNGLNSADTMTVTVDSVVTANGIKYLQVFTYPDGKSGDLGWDFFLKENPTTKYMIGQLLTNGVYKDFGARIIPKTSVKDYWTFWNLSTKPKGTYYFRIAQVTTSGTTYSKVVSVVKKK